MKDQQSTHPAFTLIELLVVISIISLLLSILLPSMVGARRTGQRVACMAGLRSIASGMLEYATDNDDLPVGSPNTSGAYLEGEPQAYGAAVQNWDFFGPLAHQWGMGLTFPSRGDVDGIKKRFDELRSSKAFLCASNKFIAGYFSGPRAGAGWMVSYNTVWYQLMTEDQVPNNHGLIMPPRWRPSIGRMGNPANKAYCADGARFSDSTVRPDFDLSTNPAFGGTFSSNPPYVKSQFNHSWNRSWANGSRSGIDARIYAYRHATSEPPQGAKGNAFKMNVAFYDGHVETQGDLQSTNPQQWLPQGTKLLARAEASMDVIKHFGLSSITLIGP